MAGPGCGWQWLSSTRNYRYVPQDTVGLRLVAGKLRARQRRKNEGVEQGETSEDNAEKQEGDVTMEMQSEGEGSSESGPDPHLPLSEQKADINISEALLKRTYYVKTTKPYSRLDQLLERRMKQHATEERNKAIFQQVILKYRQEQEARKKQAEVQDKEESGQADPEGSGHSDPDKGQSIDLNGLGLADVEKAEEEEPQYVCYSALCRSTTDSESTHNHCYSVSCRYHTAGRSRKSSVSEGDDVVGLPNGEVDVETGEVVKSGGKEEGEQDDDVDVEGDVTSPRKPLTEDSEAQSNGLEVEEEKEDLRSVLLKGSSKAEKPAVETEKAAATKDSSDGGKALSLLPGALSIQALAQGGKIQLTEKLVADLETRLACIGKTQHQVKLARQTRGPKARSKTFLRKGSLPPGHKFCTKSNKKRSLFVLEKNELRKLARREGKKESRAFHYNCKMLNVGWPYPCPRPYFKTAWRYRTQTLNSLSAAALQLRVLWACVRWDDLGSKPPAGGTNTITTETDIRTTELLKRRDIGPYGLQSEFLVRKIIVPIGVPQPSRGEV